MLFIGFPNRSCDGIACSCFALLIAGMNSGALIRTNSCICASCKQALTISASIACSNDLDSFMIDLSRVRKYRICAERILIACSKNCRGFILLLFTFDISRFQILNSALHIPSPYFAVADVHNRNLNAVFELFRPL